MFATMHIKMDGANIVFARCITSQATFHPAKGSNSSFMKSIRNKRFNIIRVIFEREMKDCVEYHCVDFTGNSFIIQDVEKQNHTGKGLTLWIDQMDQHLGMTVHDNLIVHEYSESSFISRSPSQEEIIYHQFIRTEVGEYFQGKGDQQ